MVFHPRCLVYLFLFAATAWSQQSPSADDGRLRASVAAVGPSPATVPKPQLSPEMKGDIFMARKMFREAVDAYREGPANSAVLANKVGIAFHQMLQLNLARQNYSRALKLEPQYCEPINNLGTIYYAQAGYRRAIGYYKRALRCSATPSAPIDINLGAAYFARKDYKTATEWFQEALDIDKDAFERRAGFGTLMQERTVTELAIYHLYLAKMYAKSGSSERAIAYLRKALEEGVKDREKIPSMPEFASLKDDTDFKQLLAENPKPL
jgi:tetratricopeptide (TPR) repeat protein